MDIEPPTSSKLPFILGLVAFIIIVVGLLFWKLSNKPPTDTSQTVDVSPLPTTSSTTSASPLPLTTSITNLEQTETDLTNNLKDIDSSISTGASIDQSEDTTPNL